ncbi:MAG: hypothetical protein FJZ96_12980 [Chloroflexi bacterium]|nr:hypothetical protein [Chloroflexota bacterium]
MKTNRREFYPFYLFLLASILRLIPALLLRDMGIGLDDMFQYDMLARSIVSGEGYRWYAEADLDLVQNYLPVDFDLEGYDPRGVPTSFRPPLYPVFLSLIYWLSGVGTERFFVSRIVQAFLNACLVPLTYFIARRLYPHQPAIARSAAWVVTLYPMLLIYPLALATENLFFVLALSSILVCLKAVDSRRTIHFLLAGCLLGLTALTRSVSLAFAGLAALWFFFFLKERKKAILLAAMVAIITLPWMARNTLLHGRLTGIESALGYDLYVGYHPEGTGTFQYGISLDLIPMLDDGERDEIGQALALGFICDDPGRVPYLALRRLGYFFGLERRAMTYFYASNFFGYIPPLILMALATILLVPFIIVSVSAAFGLALTRWDRKTGLVALFLVGYLIPHVFIIAEERFHYTLIPFLAILAGVFWSTRLPGLRDRWAVPRGRIALLLASAVVLLLFTNWGLELHRDAAALSELFGPEGNRLYLPY